MASALHHSEGDMDEPEEQEMDVQLDESIPTTGETDLEVITDNLPDSEDEEDSLEQEHEHEQKVFEEASVSSPITFPAKVNDVKVENWGNFCLQKINLLYEKEEHCDLTLRFTDGQSLRVHRVVLNVCTDYFANFEKIFGLSDDGELVLPKDFDCNTLRTIVKFFYTGKMEVSQNVAEVYKAVRLMNITFLVKLLEAHGKTPSSNARDTNTNNRTVVVKKKLSPTRLSGSNLSPGTIIQKKIISAKSLPPGAIKTKTVLARVQPQQFRMHGGQITKAQLTPKKLPIWKDRKFTPVKVEPSPILPPIKEEPARPTRFEWPDPEEDASNMYQSPVNNYFDKSKFTKQNPTANFETLKAQSVKRTLEIDNVSNEPPVKLVKLDDGSVDQEQDEEMSVTVGSGGSEQQIIRYPKTQITVTKSPNLHGIIKTPVSSSSSTPRVGKSVRFADPQQQSSTTISVPSTQEYNSSTGNTISVTGDNDGTHSKIISELLKKFPDLVKDSKNIRLKIVPKTDSSMKEAKQGKASYIVLKSSCSSDTTSGFVLKKGTGAAKSKFWETDEDIKKSISSAALENVTGPWTCDSCNESTIEFDSYFNFRRHLIDTHGEKIDARICEYCGYKAGKRNLLLYHLYTKHSIEPPNHISFPHCESCDYVALSEPLLAKHRSTHDALKEFVCPVCFACFKTTGALQGHMAANLHRNQETKSYECPYCKKHFIRNINLKAHIRTIHKEVARVEEMEDHDEFDSKSSNTKSSDTEKYLPSSSRLLQGISSNEDMINTHQEQIGILNADGTVDLVQNCEQLGHPITVLQSSEAEALNNVATSITTSLNLQQVHHVEQEYVEGEDGSQAVYLVDNTQTVNLGELNMPAGNTVLLTSEVEGDQGQLIVQDIHGNRFQQVTGTDENGKSIIFFQLQSQNHHTIEPEVNAPEASTQEVGIVGSDGSTSFQFETSIDGQANFSVQNDHMYLDPQKCSVFVSSGVAVPVESNTMVMSNAGTDGTQIINMIPETSTQQVTDELPHQIMESEEQNQHQEETELNDHGGQETELNDNDRQETELVSEESQECTDPQLVPDEENHKDNLHHENIEQDMEGIPEQNDVPEVVGNDSQDETTEATQEESQEDTQLLVQPEDSECQPNILEDIQEDVNSENEITDHGPHENELEVEPEAETSDQGDEVVEEVGQSQPEAETLPDETQTEELDTEIEKNSTSEETEAQAAVDHSDAETQPLEIAEENPTFMETETESSPSDRLLVVESEEVDPDPQDESSNQANIE